MLFIRLNKSKVFDVQFFVSKKDPMILERFSGISIKGSLYFNLFNIFFYIKSHFSSIWSVDKNEMILFFVIECFSSKSRLILRFFIDLVFLSGYD
jgi:hypothetical protein